MSRSARNPLDLAGVAAALRGAAAATLADLPGAQPDAPIAVRERLAAGFTDEFGHRREVGTPLLARVLGVEPGPTPASPQREAALWWALHDRNLNPDTVLLAPSPADEPGPIVFPPADDSISVETRTEAELCALHALRRLALDRSRADWRERARAAALWHVKELQPDNATNRPWGVHVFYEAALGEPDPGIAGALRFHADTLAHNCHVRLGAADRLSAFILVDAADTLEQIAGSSGPAVPDR